MTASTTGNKLYTSQLLSLSAALADFPYDATFSRAAEERSRTCGSTIKVGMDIGADGGITRIGMQVSACAVGQSSSAILAQSAKGISAHGLQIVARDIDLWLAGEGALPHWPGFDALEPALPHKGRHDALRLPWTAALKALSTPPVTG